MLPKLELTLRGKWGGGSLKFVNHEARQKTLAWINLSQNSK